ncbi:cell wall-active antibiotics response protein LiaF [Pseudolactococcus insecticola]|uniref:Uncharacterized protein n=1 Tax=Pseudolactococcus insecticola TaxID=2709158 RepID=A0A6A0B656_9LACT|nr:cell wall-active antibiotics response protein LiaF [Lactococcus insecticola]GFH40195.1 hypothetical protein Hs20B_05930 [Lactococcus insecticola]
MRKFKLLVIVEIILVALLGVSLLKSPFFMVVLAISLFMLYLSTKVRNWMAQQVLRQISAGFGIVALIMFVANGYTWLALLFPLIVGIFFWKSHPSTDYHSVNGNTNEPSQFERRKIFENGSDDAVSRFSGNDVIDLAYTNFRPSGNDIAIKKASGNTKIIVPDDVAVILDVTALSGVVKIFDELTKVNAEHVRYMSDEFGASDKRVRITVHVGRGNVEVVKG